jgi:hypothetical protein
MGDSTVNTSNNWRATGWLKSTATYGRRTLLQLLTWIVSAGMLAWVCFVCALILLPDIVSFRRRQSKTQEPGPNTRPLPIPIRVGGDIFALMPDGSRVPVSPLSASTHAQAWLEVVAGAMVFEKTRIKD